MAGEGSQIQSVWLKKRKGVIGLYEWDNSQTSAPLNDWAFGGPAIASPGASSGATSAPEQTAQGKGAIQAAVSSVAVSAPDATAMGGGSGTPITVVPVHLGFAAPTATAVGVFAAGLNPGGPVRALVMTNRGSVRAHTAAYALAAPMAIATGGATVAPEASAARWATRQQGIRVTVRTAAVVFSTSNVAARATMRPNVLDDDDEVIRLLAASRQRRMTMVSAKTEVTQ